MARLARYAVARTTVSRSSTNAAPRPIGLPTEKEDEW
jgi:hypothetical protein